MNKEQRRIVEICAEVFGVTVEQVLSQSKKSEIVKARHLAMKFLREELDITLKQIGRIISDDLKPRDHSTVTHGIAKANMLIDVGDCIVFPAYQKASERIRLLRDSDKRIILYYKGNAIHDIIRKISKEIPEVKFEIL